MLLAGCRVAQYADELTLTVMPRTLEDDGDRASVFIAAVDRYGDPGTGTVRVSSTAGSLRDGLELVLKSDGTADTEIVCDVQEDPDCHDTVTLTARWAAVDGTEVVREAPLQVRSTDAFVSACAFPNRRMLKLLAGTPPVVQLAVLDTGAEVAPGPHGVSLWDSTTGVGALVLELPSRGTTPGEEEALVRAALAAVGMAGNPLVQTFTTWDGYPAAYSTFELDAAVDLKEALQNASTALGAGPTGLTGAAGKRGPFKAQLVVALHDLGKSAVVLALHEAAGFTEAAAFELEAIADGSALSFADDRPVDHCEIFTVQPTKKVDFLWVVDDSCSMATSQLAVARVGTQAAARIQAAQLDFRVAGVSTGYYPPGYFGSTRGWTKSLDTMLAWFSGPQAWGVRGTGDERGFQALQTFIAANGDFRTDSEVHIIFLTDTRDHTPVTVAQLKMQLAQTFPKQRVVVSGIVCPEGQVCGDESELPMGKYHALIRDSGGVLGSIKVFNPATVTPALQQQQADTMNRIVGNVVTGAGYALKRRPITPSIRVAASGVVDARCDNRDIPRSTEHGWDMDPATGRIAFYGRCVPQLSGTMVVSYKTWARYGSQIYEMKKPWFAVAAPQADGGAPDAGADAGSPDSGLVDDAGSPDAGDGG